MNLSDKKILIAAQFSAPYGGNFIASLLALDKHLNEKYNVECGFLFPTDAKNKDWIKNLSKNHKVFFSQGNNSLITSREADDIIKIFEPDIVYSHFEGYDIPLNNAINRSLRNIRQIWHMHDALSFQSNIIKALYQVYCYYLHYGKPILKNSSNPPNIIAVCSHELNFIRPFRLGKRINETIIPNGVNLDRIHVKEYNPHRIPTFVAMGGRNIQKRTDILVKAAKFLHQKGVNIKVNIVGTNETKREIESNVGKLPSYIEIIPPREDINAIYEMADCFVSTSIHETFSYAIAEASYAGLPIIQSNIEGTKWNNDGKCTFLFNSGNAVDLANTIEKFLAVDSDDLKKRSSIASTYISETYSIENWADKIISFFESIN